MPTRIWPVLGDFRGFFGPGGTSYRPGRKSVLNRKFAENNFFLAPNIKNYEKMFGN